LSVNFFLAQSPHNSSSMWTGIRNFTSQQIGNY